MLEKTKTLLDLQEDNYAPGDDRMFVSSPDSDRATSLTLDAKVWKELGKPETVTVTVQPGYWMEEDA